MDFLEVSSTKMSRDSLALIAVRYLQATHILTVRVVVASQTFSGNGLAVEWPLIGLDEAEKPLARDIKLVVDGNLASMVSIVFR